MAVDAQGEEEMPGDFEGQDLDDESRILQKIEEFRENGISTAALTSQLRLNSNIISPIVDRLEAEKRIHGEKRGFVFYWRPGPEPGEESVVIRCPIEGCKSIRTGKCAMDGMLAHLKRKHGVGRGKALQLLEAADHGKRPKVVEELSEVPVDHASAPETPTSSLAVPVARVVDGPQSTKYHNAGNSQIGSDLSTMFKPKTKASPLVTETLGLIRRIRDDTPSPNEVRPDHYRGLIQPLEYERIGMTQEEIRGFLRGNAMKYLMRYRRKGGVEDLRKAHTYVGWLIEHEEKAEIRTRTDCEMIGQ